MLKSSPSCKCLFIFFYNYLAGDNFVKKRKQACKDRSHFVLSILMTHMHKWYLALPNLQKQCCSSVGGLAVTAWLCVYVMGIPTAVNIFTQQGWAAEPAELLWMELPWGWLCWSHLELQLEDLVRGTAACPLEGVHPSLCIPGLAWGKEISVGNSWRDGGLRATRSHQLLSFRQHWWRSGASKKSLHN